MINKVRISAGLKNVKEFSVGHRKVLNVIIKNASCDYIDCDDCPFGSINNKAGYYCGTDLGILPSTWNNYNTEERVEMFTYIRGILESQFIKPKYCKLKI